MKKLFACLLSVVLLCGLFTVALAETVSPEVQAILDRGKLLVGVKADVPGFGYQELGGTFEGLEIDLAHALAEAILGDPNAVEFTAVTAKTRGPLLDTGELDAVLATFTIKADRLLQYEFSKPYFVDAIGLLVKKDAGVAGFADLNGKNIGVAQAATTKDALTAAADEAGYTLTFSEFPTYPDIKAALDSGRVDCFSVDKAILMGYVDDTVVLLPDSFASQPYGVALKKGNEGLLAVVNGLIADLRASGELDTLVAKWNLVAIDWAEVDGYGESIWAEAEALAAAQ
ncbi:amino acid ABC transporter substrate-binding protein [Clostridia bacterium]|nr:amino acid ABC transporter substrate-binding protein [Clostridia bacterium]